MSESIWIWFHLIISMSLFDRVMIHWVHLDLLISWGISIIFTAADLMDSISDSEITTCTCQHLHVARVRDLIFTEYRLFEVYLCSGNVLSCLIFVYVSMSSNNFCFRLIWVEVSIDTRCFWSDQTYSILQLHFRFRRFVIWWTSVTLRNLCNSSSRLKN